MRYFALFSLLLIFTSCVDESYEINYFITNNSNHSIKFEFYSNQVSLPNLTLFEGETKSFNNISKGSFDEGFFPSSEVDSVKISFDNIISVIHNSQIYDLQRNILVSESFQLIQNESNYREFMYQFSNNDFDEALANQ
jgi:hypothetical protein